MHFGRFGHTSFGFDGTGKQTGGRAGLLSRVVQPAFWLLSLLAFAVFLTTAEPSFAAASGKRLALVIGNSNYKYKNAIDLPNAAGDAQAIAGKLKELGFEVDTGVDVNLDTFENMLYEFRDKIRATGAEDVVFYYAGHGFQLDGRNHLVPTDAKLSAREKIGYETVQLNGLIKRINADPEKQRTIVFLDACRDNPLPESVRGEDFENGLADVQMGKDGDNVMVIFSTRPGDVSQDGKDGNSPFAQSLLRHIATPNETVTDMMTEVSNEVSEATGNLQSPRFSGILRSKFYFNLKSSIVATSEPTDEPPAQPPSADSSEAPRKPQAAPSVTLSQDDNQPLNPAPEPPQQSPETPPVEITGKPPEMPAPVEPAPPASATPQQPSEIAAGPPEPPTAVAPQSEAPTVMAQRSADTVKPEAPVDAAPAPKPSQAETPSAVAPLEAAPPQLKEKKMASLEPGEPARQPALSSGPAVDPAPDRSIAVIRPSAAEPESGVPVAGKQLKIVQRTNDTQALQPSGERYEDEEKKVAELTPPTENVEPPPETEPVEQDQSSLFQQVQDELSRVECFAGTADGQWGRDSEAALARYLKEKGSNLATEPTEEVLSALQQETEPVCTSESTQPEPPAVTKKPGRALKPDVKRRPPVIAKPPVVRTPPPVKRPPPIIVRKPPPVKKPPVKLVTQQPKKPKSPPPPAKKPPATPPIKIQGVFH